MSGPDASPVVGHPCPTIESHCPVPAGRRLDHRARLLELGTNRPPRAREPVKPRAARSPLTKGLVTP